MQRFQSLQLQMMLMLAQAFQQRPCERGGELQPVALSDVGCTLLHRVKTTEQPRDHALGIVVRHREPFGITEEAVVQARVLAEGQMLRGGAVQTVEPGAQALTVLPQPGRIKRRVMLMDLPAVFLFIQQRHGHARDLKTPRQMLQLFQQYVGQARQAAQAQLITDLCREQLAEFAAARLPAFVQQIADVQ